MVPPKAGQGTPGRVDKVEEQRGLHSKVWEKWVAWNVLTSLGVWARVWPGLVSGSGPSWIRTLATPQLPRLLPSPTWPQWGETDLTDAPRDEFIAPRGWSVDVGAQGWGS